MKNARSQRLSRLCGLVCTALAVLANEGKAEDPYMPLTYGGRTVDLAPYYFSYPYYLMGYSEEAGKLFYSETDETGAIFLRALAWDPGDREPLDLSRGQAVTSVDLNTINFWERHYNPALDGILARADESKREDINLWLFSEGSGPPRRLTDADYVYNFFQTLDGHDVYFTSRYGTSEDGEGCLEHMRIDEDARHEVQNLFCDSDGLIEAKLNTWKPLRADAEKLIFTAFAEGDRTLPELYAYYFEDGTAERLVVAHGASGVWVWSEWYESTDFLYVRDKRLYYFNAESGEAHLLWTFEESPSERKIVKRGDDIFIVMTTDGVLETQLQVFRLADKSLEVVDTWLTDIRPNFSFGDGNDWLVSFSSTRVLRGFELFSLTPEGTLLRRSLLPELEAINRDLAACNVDLITYESRDDNELTAGTYDIQAFLYTPKDPPASAEQLYIIQAFYGGRNGFVRGFHSLCSVGVAILSPAVRGDWRLGDSFELANDGEKADAPIRDVIAGARYLVERFDIRDESQIGTWGYSHGGWAALRAMTYPGPERFGFGFALAGAGYFDMLHIVEDPDCNVNIHGWISKEFGDIETQRDTLRFHSPTEFLDLVQGPIFLYHGENDERISLQCSLDFVQLLEARGLTYHLEVIAGQGHSIQGAHNWHAVYSALFRFLDGYREDRASGGG